MAINYPTSLDTLSNPSPTDLQENATAALDHNVQHSNANDAIEALEAKVGADGSAVTTSHDYKLSGVTGTDKAVSKTGTETLTNKTLTSPVINLGSDATGDMYYRNGSGALTRFPAGADGTIISYSSGIPTTIANPSAADASTTVKGVGEEATQAETIARATAGGTSARLFVNPSTLTTVQTYDYAASSGGTDTYAISVTPAPTAYVTGQVFRVKADVANTGAATLNVNSLGAKTIKKSYNSDLVTGDILASQIFEVIYDGTNFQLISPTVIGTPRALITTSFDGSSGDHIMPFGSEYYAGGLGAGTTGTYGAVVPFAGTVSKLSVRAKNASSTHNATFTVYKNDSSQSMTISFLGPTDNAYSVKSDSSNTFSVAAGDSLYVVGSHANDGSGNRAYTTGITLEIQPTS